MTSAPSICRKSHIFKRFLFLKLSKLRLLVMGFFVKALPLFIHVFLSGGQRCHSNTSIPIRLYAHQTAYDITSNALYLFGGKLPQNEYSQSIYKWDINTDTWTKLSVTTPTSTPKGSSVEWFLSYVNAAVTINDIVYFIGINDGYYNSGTVYRFRLTTSKWLSPASIAPPPRPSTKGCLSHNTTHILMVGGQYSANPSDLYTDQLQIYRISSNTWSTETINVSPIQGQGWVHGYCQSIGIDLYVFGGSTTESESDAIDNIFKYNPSDKWTSIGTLPQVQGYGVALYNERSRAIYLVGGYAGDAVNPYVDTVYVFDVDSESITDTWTMEHARSSMPAEIINNRLYVFGGQDENMGTNTIPLSSIEVCAIPVSPTNTPSKYPSKRPSASPVHNPSVSPSQQPSNRPTSSPTSPPSHPSLRATMPSLDVSSKLTSTVDVTRDVLTFHSSTSQTNMNINATHNTFDYVLLIVLILVTVLTSVAAVGLRCCCKRKTKVTELEAHQKDSIKTRPMISNVSVIPLETIEGIQKEMAYTNEGPSNTNEINTSDGNINVAMVLKGSARMTR
eukprot:421487_1